MKVQGSLVLVTLAMAATGCSATIEYNPQSRPSSADAAKGAASQEVEVDHPRSKDIVEVTPVAPEEEEMDAGQAEEVQPSEKLSQADILALDNVKIEGNGDLLENSPEFAKRYVGPNGEPLNVPENTLTLRQGQTLSVCNAENAQNGIQIHTNGSRPFPHGARIDANECVEYSLDQLVEANGNNIYDHLLGGANNNRDYPIFINVISDEDAQAIIDAAASE